MVSGTAKGAVGSALYWGLIFFYAMWIASGPEGLGYLCTNICKLTEGKDSDLEAE